MSPAQPTTPDRLIRDIHELAESVRVDHVPETGRFLPSLNAADLYRLLPRIFRNAALVTVGDDREPLTRPERATLRAVANLIEESAPAAAPGYCEYCGSGPVCVVCERGVIG